MVLTTVGLQTQPQMDSPARRGRPRSPMNIAGLMWETITTVGTPMVTPVEFGATLQTLTRDGSTALCLNVKRQMEWKMLDVRRRTYG